MYKGDAQVTISCFKGDFLRANGQNSKHTKVQTQNRFRVTDNVFME